MMYSIVDWNDLLAFLGVLAAVFGVIQWVVVRVLIAPMLAAQTQELKEWTDERFISLKDFNAHISAMSLHTLSRDRELEATSRELGKIWKHLDRGQHGPTPP